MKLLSLDPTAYPSDWTVKSFDRTKGIGVLERPGSEDVVFDFSAWVVDPAQLQGADELLPCAPQLVVVTWKKSFMGRIVPAQIKPQQTAASAVEPVLLIPADLPAPLEKLWRLALRLAGSDARKDIESALGEIGLFLGSLVEPGDYAVTPKNSVAFAWTGGDGVHFSLVKITPALKDAPVVVTVPGNWDDANLIVGANLPDFLALGCRTGFDCAEQLVYEREQTIAEIEAAGRQTLDLSSPTGQLLSVLSEEFALEPWRDIAAKLERLQQEIAPQLDCPTP